MTICRIVGRVVSTMKSPKLNGFKLMVLHPIDIKSGKELNNTIIAVDTINAGVGETVLVVSGSSARQTKDTENKPVDATIVAIVDYIDIDGIKVELN